MEEIKERLKDISEIRTILEHQTKFLSLSGLSGITAGIAALGGAAAAWLYLGSPSQMNLEGIAPMLRGGGSFFDKVTLDLMLIAAAVVVVALSGAVFFSRRMAKKHQLPFWNPSAKRMVLNLSIPLIAGGLLCLIQLYHGTWEWIASNMLVFYGFALLNASKYTLNEIRYLGMMEIFLGLCSAMWWGNGFWFWIAGFGLLHIVYGGWLYLKHER